MATRPGGRVLSRLSLRCSCGLPSSAPPTIAAAQFGDRRRAQVVTRGWLPAGDAVGRRLLQGAPDGPPGILPLRERAVRPRRGWNGGRVWQWMERELTVETKHDRRRYVSLGVTLRPSGPGGDDSGWSATAVFVLEAGAEMSRLAGDLAHWSRR
ncbi:DUF6228 family protein [Actinoplanes xinjiangensis]|uniref:DUF6228 family protein n=1 Tax=Actinoplanes xinjiangensis TaxID=512350 RepID=UPI0034210B80